MPGTIDGAAYSPTTVRVAIASQSTLGTAETTQGNFTELHITDLPSFDPLGGYIVDDTMRHDGQHVLGKRDNFKTTAGGTWQIQVPFLATFQDLAILLPSLFQNSDTVGDVTTYTWDEATDKVSGASPTMVTVLVDDPEDPYHVHSAILKTLQCTGSMDADGGRMRCTATFVSGYASVRGVTATPASWTAPSTNWFSFGSLTTMQVNSEDFVCTGFDFTFDNGAVRLGSGTGGVPQGYVIGVANKKGYMGSGTINALYDGVTEGWLDLAVVNNAAQSTPGYPISFIWNSGVLNNELQINLYAIIDNASLEAGSEMGMERGIPFRCIANGTNDAVQMKLDDNSGA